MYNILTRRDFRQKSREKVQREREEKAQGQQTDVVYYKLEFSKMKTNESSDMWKKNHHANKTRRGTGAYVRH